MEKFGNPPGCFGNGFHGALSSTRAMYMMSRALMMIHLAGTNLKGIDHETDRAISAL
jgi:hypothetical protein